MKIYISIPWFSPAYKAGGPIQSIANMVEELGSWQLAVGSGAFRFKIFCSNKDLDGSLLQGIAFDEWVKYDDHTEVWYSSTNTVLPVLKQEIRKERPGFLFITGIFSWQYNFKPLLFCKGVKKIISVRGMLHPGALSQKPFKKKIYLWLWKRLGVHKQWAVGSEQLAVGRGEHIFHATDAEEKNYIQQVFGSNAKIAIAANFPNLLPVQPVAAKEKGQLKLVSIALISPMKNILLVLEALSSGQLAVGSWQSSVVSGQSSVFNKIEYNIYGPVKDKKYWEQCLLVIKRLPENIVVHDHGDIEPDKIERVLAASHVFILPSKSENFGHAIYEALSAGRPVITSHNTPWNDLEKAGAGINVSLTEKRELVNAIEHFAGMDQGQLNTWSSGARSYAEKAVDVNTIRQQYEALFGQ